MAKATEPTRTPREATAAALTLLAVSNLVANNHLSDAQYVPWNLAVTSSLVALARGIGIDETDLGLDRRAFGHSLRVGAVGAAAVAVAYGTAALTRAGRRAFDDERVTTLSDGHARFQMLVRIPFGTVLTEETIFRGVLPALFARSRMPLAPGVASSLLFGLWHILPSLELNRLNAAVGRVAGRRRNAVAAAVATTTVAGLFLHRLRDRTGHLAAPVMVHLAANVIGFEGARLARHRG